MEKNLLSVLNLLNAGWFPFSWRISLSKVLEERVFFFTHLNDCLLKTIHINKTMKICIHIHMHIYIYVHTHVCVCISKERYLRALVNILII